MGLQLVAHFKYVVENKLKSYEIGKNYFASVFLVLEAEK